MVTVDEETQAKDFLKRAEIRTMRKDLLALREADSLKERDKIATIKTLEEQQSEHEKELEKATGEKAAREQVLQKNEQQETIAEKDLKNYATEQERQQMFLLESQRLAFEKQSDEIDQKKDPALKLEKNKLLLSKRDWQDKLNAILEQEKKLEGEQGFLSQKAQASNIPEERKGLEARRWDIDKEIQEIEKKRWEAEKQIQDADTRVVEVDKSSESLVIEKNGLRDKILGIDKSLREIYSAVIAKEEEKRSGQAKEQIEKREALAKVRLEEKEKVQRQQWAPTFAKQQVKEEGYLSKAPKAIKERLEKSAQEESKQREKFLHDIEDLSHDPKDTPSQTQPQVQTSAIPLPLKAKHSTPAPVAQPQLPAIPPVPQAPPVPAVPHKN
jgi:hypothetical protein